MLVTPSLTHYILKICFCLDMPAERTKTFLYIFELRCHSDISTYLDGAHPCRATADGPLRVAPLTPLRVAPLQSHDRQYKAPKHNTKPKNIRQNLQTSIQNLNVLYKKPLGGIQPAIMARTVHGPVPTTLYNVSRQNSL